MGDAATICFALTVVASPCVHWRFAPAMLPCIVTGVLGALADMIVLFANPRRRALHDLIAVTVVVHD